MPSQGWNYEPAEDPDVRGWTDGTNEWFAVAIGGWIGKWGWVDVWKWSDDGFTYVCWRNEDGFEVPVEGNYPDLAQAMDAVEAAYGATVEVANE